MFNFIKNISPTEIAIVVLILIVLFGAKAVAILGKRSGEVVKELKNVKKEFTKAMDGDDGGGAK